MTHIKSKITGMIIETSNQAGNNSPMSLEDPDEPSPSPINPITLKHTLRLASRVSISNNAKIEEKYFEEYPNSSLLTELGETLKAISVNDFSFSPSPTKLSKLPEDTEAKFIKSILPKSNYREKVKKSQKLCKKNNRRSKLEEEKTKKHIRKDSLNENIECCEIFDLNVQETAGEVEIQSYESILGQTINKSQSTDGKETNDSEIKKSTPLSFGSNESFRYSRWIKKNSIKNFISRYIPRFLIPAFKAIENLRIKFAIPTKIVEYRREVGQKKEKVKKKIKLKRK
ncbi:Uncharacterized protein cpbgf_8002763 [Cryptosporidium parvum]|uniref:Uncharacterized protein n=1 Tax=Cryptosporidium parvum TaxID=5807 RepID=A0A7S7LD91_CRYPV|nr:Uncharacterized protein CPATCC_0002890 [Cryptosporidium parvum]WRK34032.1 Uncharacterized protein cpbgf_8002763 [Cryptosporidium parvum]|eukprot:QOY40034.1 hypothetical protein CPATCC_004103 [Cryptosporidium parvum]